MKSMMTASETLQLIR